MWAHVNKIVRARTSTKPAEFMNYKMINILNERSVKKPQFNATNSTNEMHFNRKLFVHLFSYLSVGLLVIKFFICFVTIQK